MKATNISPDVFAVSTSITGVSSYITSCRSSLPERSEDNMVSEVDWRHLVNFRHFRQGRQLFLIPYCFPAHKAPSEKGSTL